MKQNNVVVVDAVRTAFGRAGEKGLFWQVRSDDLCVALARALMARNPKVAPDTIEESIWGVTNQMKEQGGTLGRMVPMLADLGWSIPGCSVDRMCAGGLTAVGYACAAIASGMHECVLAGGTEHLGHVPMGFMRENHPRAAQVMGGDSALSMGQTAENLHDRFPDLTRERADLFATESQRKAAEAIGAGKMKGMLLPVKATLADGAETIADRDQQPRPGTTPEALAALKTPFRENGNVTAGNASGLNDGAAAVLLMSEDRARELSLRPLMRWVATGTAGVDPTIMGIAPVPATQKALRKAGLSIGDIDIIEVNEAFAVQVLYFLSRMGLADDDPRVNRWGGAIAYGHPLAASGPRLVAFLAGLFTEDKNARYGLTAMCVGRGQGYSIIWENMQGE